MPLVGKISKIDRALEELKKHVIFALLPVSDICYTHKRLVEVAQNLVKALDDEKIISKNKICVHCDKELGITVWTSSFKLGLFCSAKCAEFEPASKPEPKIDIKEERVNETNADKRTAIRFGVSELDVKASREYQKIYGEFHPLSDVYSNFRTARVWYDRKQKEHLETVLNLFAEQIF